MTSDAAAAVARNRQTRDAEAASAGAATEKVVISAAGARGGAGSAAPVRRLERTARCRCGEVAAAAELDPCA
jgi:hypothetical protein